MEMKISKADFLWSTVLIIILSAVSIGFATCGGKKSISTSSGSLNAIRQEAEKRKSPLLSAKKVAQVEEILSELSVLSAPDGVDPALFESLKAEFSRILSARASGRIVSTPPIGPINRVEDLRVVPTESGGYELTWGYKNVGDYNQDGIADVADIAKLAEEFLRSASADNEWVDGNGDGKIDIADIPPLAENFFGECAYYVIEGSTAVGGPYFTIGQVNFSEATGSGRKRFTYELGGLTYTNFRVTPYDSSGQPGEPSRDTLSANTLSITNTLTVTGIVRFDTGEMVNGATINAKTEDNLSMDDATTGADGLYELELAPPVMPVEIIIKIDYTDPDTGLLLTNFKTMTLESGGTLEIEPTILTNPANSALVMQGDRATAEDGSVLITELPDNVAQVYAKAYDPGANPEAFPGEFAEVEGAGLNSSSFVWVTGQDSSGAQVTYLSSPSEMHLEIPSTQWADIEDTQPGNGQIDVPIYDLNYDTGQWESEANDGFLISDSGEIIPEELVSDINSGNFAGRIYAKFSVDHFSYWNVDYPYIYIWTLSHLNGNKRQYRQNECLYKAMKLAERIAKSQTGRNAYAKVNDAGKNLDDEFKDGQGPEIDVETLTDANGEYRGEGKKEKSPDKLQLFLHQGIWDWCGPNTSEAQKQKTILLIASTLLHETAHWKDDVKKTGADTPGEEGKQLEQDIFGGDISMSYKTGELYVKDITKNGPPKVATQAQIDNWLNANTWRSADSLNVSKLTSQSSLTLQIIITSPSSVYFLGEPIPITIEFRNGGDEPFYFPNVFVLEGWPVDFVITDDVGNEVPFLGPEVHLNLLPDDYVVLNPGESLSFSFDLLGDLVNGILNYDLLRQGNYTVKAVHPAENGFDETESNTLNITIGPGGNISGTVTDADTGDPINGAFVRAVKSNRIVSTVRTGMDGTYLLSSLPVGTYSVESYAAGYSFGRVTDVTVTSGQTVSGVDFALKPGGVSEWFMFGKDHSHRRRSPALGPRTSNIWWATQIAPVQESYPSIGPDGTIYIGSLDSNLYALYPNGTIKWRTLLGGGVNSTPAVGPDMTIYVGCSDYNLYAVSPEGNILWSFPTTDAINSSPAVGFDGTIYVGSRGGWFYAINPDGTEKWKFEDTGFWAHQIASSPAIAPDGTIYVGSDSYNLYSFAPNGTLNWTYVGQEMIYSSPAIGDDGAVYFGTWAGQSQSGRGAVYALNPDGSLRWSYDAGAYDVDASPAIGWDETIYVGSTEGKFYALNPDGTLKWTYTANGEIRSSAAVGGDGTIYFSDNANYIYALNPDGTLLWSYQTGGGFDRTGPIIAPDGSLYAGGGDGRLYKFKD